MAGVLLAALAVFGIALLVNVGGAGSATGFLGPMVTKSHHGSDESDESDESENGPDGSSADLADSSAASDPGDPGEGTGSGDQTDWSDSGVSSGAGPTGMAAPALDPSDSATAGSATSDSTTSGSATSGSAASGSPTSGGGSTGSLSCTKEVSNPAGLRTALASAATGDVICMRAAPAVDPVSPIPPSSSADPPPVGIAPDKQVTIRVIE